MICFNPNYCAMQIDDLSNLSDIDDLASTFAKVCYLF